MKRSAGRAALLRCSCLLAWVPSAAAEAGAKSGGLAVKSGRVQDAAIPQWRLEQALGPSTAASWQLGTPVEARAGEPVEGAAAGKLGSTAAQDSGRCPLVKLPSKLGMTAVESSWASQGGVWQGSSNVVHSSFRLWFLSTTWDTTYIRNLDEQGAFRVDVTSDQELEYSHGWRRQKSPLDYPAIAKLEKDWWAAIYKGAYTPLMSPDMKYGENIDNPDLWHTTSLLDCEGQLLFVVKLLQQDLQTLPGGIDVYDRQGGLVAHAMVDFQIARYQFVDANGNMIATAEAPGVGLSISMKDLKPDASKGGILPYEVKFEKGGYYGASRLLDSDYRWVIAAAVQARALDDAHRNWTPWAPRLLVAMYCMFAVLMLALICCACGAIYRLVYPLGDAQALPPLWDKKGQPQMYSGPM